MLVLGVNGAGEREKKLQNKYKKLPQIKIYGSLHLKMVISFIVCYFATPRVAK